MSQSSKEAQSQETMKQRFIWEGLRLWVEEKTVQGEFNGIVGSSLAGYRPFFGLPGMLHAIERTLDRMQAPQTTHELRKFWKKGRNNGARQRRTQDMQEDSMKTAPERKPTFVVHIRYRQNATWQGTVQWVEAKETRNFRSALELINLMEDAIADGAPEPRESWQAEH